MPPPGTRTGRPAAAAASRQTGTTKRPASDPRRPRPAGTGRPPPPPPKKKPKRAGKVVLALVSLLVLGLTGYSWAAMQGLINGLQLANVIGDDGGGDKPADGARDILLVGLDSRTDAQGNPLPKEVLAELRAGAADGELNTDSLVFVHIPNDGSKAVAISLPRDSYVDIPGYGKHKINSAYGRAKLDESTKLQSKGVSDPKEIEVRSNEAGAKKLIETVQKLTGSTIDNYAAVNLLGFSEITKAIGGVDVCLNGPVNDQFSGARFRAGPQALSGADALAFVRQRHDLPRGDLDRVVRQQVFMAGLAKKVLSAGTLTDPGKLNDLITAVKKSVVLDQNWDILKFAQQMKGLTGGQIEFRTIPIVNMDYTTPEDGSAIQVDARQVKDFVQGLAGPPAPPAPPPSAAENAKITVDVRNASGVTGLAANVSKTLTDQGFLPGATSNATSRATTVIRVPAGGQAAGKRVADALGGTASVEQDNTIPQGHVAVFLGSDYTGPGTGSAGGQNLASAPLAKPAPNAPPPAQPDDPQGGKPITADGVACVN